MTVDSSFYDAILQNAGILGAVVDSKKDQGDQINGIVYAKSKTKTDKTIPEFLKAMETHRHWNRPERLQSR